MLIQPEDRRKDLGRAGLRVLDTRSQADYDRGHIPGAVRVDTKSWAELGKKDGGFHDARAWGACVRVHDDLLATGGTADALCRLVGDLGAEIAGCAFLVELTFLGGRSRLEPLPVHTLVTYGD